MKLDSTKVALVTGASSGFGLAISQHLAAHGVRIVMGDLNDSAGEAAAQAINKQYGEKRAIYRHCDVTRAEDQRALFEAGVDAFGGVFPLVPTWTKVIDINFTAVTLGVELGYEYLKRRGGGYCLDAGTSSMEEEHNIRVNAVAPSFVATAMVTTAQKQGNLPTADTSKDFQLMPLSLVIEAMDRLIVDESLAGEIARVTPQYGVNIVRWKGKL
ncbi:hypothetical protein BDF19DRAFT_445201 [Syncephalis fuscata]|nr:hypothetical protein BDF19DRAFT_445201 [Syncephalis fuscata]